MQHSGAAVSAAAAAAAATATTTKLHHATPKSVFGSSPLETIRLFLTNGENKRKEEILLFH